VAFEGYGVGFDEVADFPDGFVEGGGEAIESIGLRIKGSGSAAFSAASSR
jgi:hypothetical protein